MKTTEAKYTLPKKLTLDRSKWVSGYAEKWVGEGDGKPSHYDTETTTGRGSSSLLNGKGYMCCVGQWCHQAGIPLEDLKYYGIPLDLQLEIEGLVYYSYYNQRARLKEVSWISQAVEINDAPHITLAEKEEQLTALLAEQDIELEIIGEYDQPKPEEV